MRRCRFLRLASISLDWHPPMCDETQIEMIVMVTCDQKALHAIKTCQLNGIYEITGIFNLPNNLVIIKQK